MPPKVGLKKPVKSHCAKASLGEDSTVLEISTSRIALMTFERGNLILRLRGAWSAPVASVPKEQGRGPSPAGIAVQAPDVAATLNGAALPEEAVDQLSTLSDLRKSELFKNIAVQDPQYERKNIRLATKFRPLEAFVHADVSPIGALVSEVAQLEGNLLARIKKHNEPGHGEVRVYSISAPRFRVAEKMYCLDELLTLWGVGVEAVDLSDLDRSKGV